MSSSLTLGGGAPLPLPMSPLKNAGRYTSPGGPYTATESNELEETPPSTRRTRYTKTTTNSKGGQQYQGSKPHKIVRLITNESRNDKSARDSSSARTVTCSTLVIMTFPQGMVRHGGYAAELATAGQIAFSWARTRDKRQKRWWHPAASLLHEIATVLRAATKRVTRKCEIYSVMYATKF